MRPRSPNVLPFFLPVIGLVALRSPASTVTIRLMESLPRLNVSAGAMLNVSTIPAAVTLVLASHTTDVQVRRRWRLIFNKHGEMAFLRTVAMNTDLFCDMIPYGLVYITNVSERPASSVIRVFYVEGGGNIFLRICALCLKLHRTVCNSKVFFFKLCFPLC